MKSIILSLAGLRSVGLLITGLLTFSMVTGCQVDETAVAEEFGVVTCEHGYIVDESDEILETLQTFAVVDITEEIDGVLVVRSASGTTGRMLIEQVHRSSWFEQITPENSRTIRKALNLVEAAHAGPTGSSKRSSLELMQDGLDTLESALGKKNTGYAWFLSYMANMQLGEDNPEAAERTLQQAESILKELDALESLHAADVHNARAILAQYNGDYETAVAEFQKAIEISTEFLGDSHSDVRVVNANLASCWSDQGDFEQAIEHQRLARSIAQTIFPADVIERIDGNRTLATYLSAAERYEEALPLLLEAKEMLEADQSSSLATLIETGMDVGECYYSLGDNAMARRRLEKVLTALTENGLLDELTDEDTRSHFTRLYLLLGLVEQAVSRNEVALAHFENSISRASKEEPDALVARSAEEAGIVAAELQRFDIARKYFEQSIAIYKAIEGDDSGSAERVTELMTAMTSRKPGPKPSKTDPVEYAIVTAPHGYLTDRDDNVIAVVPAFSMLSVLGTNDDSYFVFHDDQELLIRHELVRKGNLLPSHGVMAEQDAKPFYDRLAKARQLQLSGDLPSAHGAFIAVIDDLSKQVGVDNPFYVQISCNIAVCAAQQGGLGLAERILDQQADYLKQLDQEGHPVIVDVLATLSYIRFLGMQHDEAVSLMQKAMALQKTHGLQETAEATIPLQILVSVDLQRGDFDSALKRQEEIMAISSRSFPGNSFEFAAAQAGLGMTRIMTDPKGNGLQLMEDALRIAEKTQESPDQINSLRVGYGLFLKFSGDVVNAKKQLQKALDNFPKEIPFLLVASKLNALTELADIAVQERQYDAAVRLGEEGVAVIESTRKQYSVGNRMTIQIASRLHEVLIAAHENAGNSAAAKRHSDLLKQVTSEIAKISSEESSTSTKENADTSTKSADMTKDSTPQSLSKMPAESTDIAGSADGSIDPAFASFHLTPPHEFMLVTTQATSIHRSPNGPVITPIAKDQRVWSLESANGWSRVRVPGKDGFGWINQQHTAEQNSMLLTTMLQTRLVEAQNKNLDSAALGKKAEEVMSQFEKARQLTVARDTAGALSLFEAAVSGSREVLGDNNPLSVMIRTEMAEAYLISGQFSRARALLEESLPVTRKTMGENHPRAASDSWRLANLLSMIADLQGAKEQLREAIRIAEAAYGQNDIRTQMFQIQLGQLLIQQGQLDQAETIMKNVQQTLKQVENADVPNPLSIHATSALGVIEFHREKYKESHELSAMAEDQYAALGEAFQIARRNSQIFRGLALFRQGLFSEAEPVLAEAAADLAASGHAVPDVRIRLSLLNSTIAFIKGNTDQALELIESAIEDSLRVYGEDHISSSSLYSHKAHILAGLGKITESRSAFKANRESVFKYVNQTLADLPVREQTAFLKLQDKHDLNRALSMSLRADAGDEDHTLSATWLLNARNLPHELSARSGQVRRLLKSRTQVDAYEQYRAARERLATMPSGVATAEEQAFRDEEQARQKKLMQNAFDSLPAEIRSQIQLQSASYADSIDVRKALHDDETLVEIIRMIPTGYGPEETARQLNPQTRQPEQYVAWIMPPFREGAANPSVQVISLGTVEDIDRQVALIQQSMLQSLKTINTDGHAIATQSVLADCQYLSDTVWSPIQKALNGRSKVILSPDGELWRAPWATLPVGDNRLLIEDYEIRLVISGRELLRKKSENLVLSAPIILADPDYDASESALLNALRAIFPSRRDEPLSGNLDTQSLRASMTTRAARLPGTAIEAKAVLADVRKMSSREPSIFLQAQASEQTFRRTTRPYSVMFSTHGFFLPQEKLAESQFGDSLATSPGSAAALGDAADPLMRCGLLLAGCNQRDVQNSSSDGILLGREIVEIDLRGTKLVVLSACETGLGDVADGQGIAGLRQAFQLAGAESIVSTLWSIEDKETAH